MVPSSVMLVWSSLVMEKIIQSWFILLRIGKNVNSMNQKKRKKKTRSKMKPSKSKKGIEQRDASHLSADSSGNECQWKWMKMVMNIIRQLLLLTLKSKKEPSGTFFWNWILLVVLLVVDVAETKHKFLIKPISTRKTYSLFD